jgi:hypothetical protein
VKFGKTYRIYRSELNRYIKERTTKKEEWVADCWWIFQELKLHPDTTR